MTLAGLWMKTACSDWKALLLPVSSQLIAPGGMILSSLYHFFISWRVLATGPTWKSRLPSSFSILPPISHRTGMKLSSKSPPPRPTAMPYPTS